jgi:hypothetical protein
MAEARVDHRLNLVVPIYEDDEGERVLAYAYSTPLPRETVERHFFELGQAFSQIYSQGFGMVAGQAVGMMLLQQVGRNTGRENEVGALVAEIRRLTLVVVPAPNKDAPEPWQSVPLAIAAERGFISDDDRAEVENAVVFFICSSAMLPRRARKEMVTGAAALWGARVTSSSATEFIASLRTSSATGSTGAKSPAPAPAAAATATVTVDGKRSSLPH